jgi:hypothetical protein
MTCTTQRGDGSRHSPRQRLPGASYTRGVMRAASALVAILGFASCRGAASNLAPSRPAPQRSEELATHPLGRLHPTQLPRRYSALRLGGSSREYSVTLWPGGKATVRESLTLRDGSEVFDKSAEGAWFLSGGLIVIDVTSGLAHSRATLDPSDRILKWPPLFIEEMFESHVVLTLVEGGA